MIRPLRDQVLIKRDDPPTMAGSIIMPEVARDWRSTQGTVTGVGPKCSELRVGDRVLLPPLGGKEHRIDGQLIGLWKESEVFGVLEKAPELIDA